jgi:hypothetical protein
VRGIWRTGHLLPLTSCAQQSSKHRRRTGLSRVIVLARTPTPLKGYISQAGAVPKVLFSISCPSLAFHDLPDFLTSETMGLVSACRSRMNRGD